MWNIYLKNYNLNFCTSQQNSLQMQKRHSKHDCLHASHRCVSIVHPRDRKLWKNFHTPWADGNLESSALRKECISLKSPLREIAPFYNCFFFKEKVSWRFVPTERTTDIFQGVSYNEKQPITRRWKGEFRMRIWHNKSTRRVRIQIKWQILHMTFYSEII